MTAALKVCGRFGTCRLFYLVVLSFSVEVIQLSTTHDIPEGLLSHFVTNFVPFSRTGAFP